jgi:dTDP-4-dehydrorhamnose reductase
MRVLILGANGMLGHKLYQECHPCFDVSITTRKGPGRCQFEASTGAAIRLLRSVQPDAVVNCIGIVKQRESTPLEMFRVNGIFPRALAAACTERNIRLIQISTDCVFSGNDGPYTEEDEPDPVDDYGWSKLAGETEDHLTIRTSFIGRELETSRGLLEWFLSQDTMVRGFTNAIFSGLTTRALAKTIADVLAYRPGLKGIYHVGGDPISKYHLLHLLKAAYDKDVEIVPDAAVPCDRSLVSAKFRKAADWECPSWEEMVEDMAADPTPYEEWRKAC